MKTHIRHWKTGLWGIGVLILAMGIITDRFGEFDASADQNPGTNISSSPAEQVAWSDLSGWWNFHDAHAVDVKGTYLTGYLNSSIGDISLDCATMRNENICGVSNYGICNGPGPHDPDGTCPNGNGSGVLYGYAWNDSIGWISFNCDQSSFHEGDPAYNDCLDSYYRVEIDGDSGDFSGYAWNDLEGWISFNGPGYGVKTDWRAISTEGFLESSVFDTEALGGVVLNSVIWQGTQPGGGGSVDFQVAVSNCPNGATNPPDCTTGTWSFVGPDGTNETYYGAECPSVGISSPAAGPNRAICIDPNQTLNFRYLRYKVRLKSNLIQTESPVITDIVLNWSE